MRKFREAAETTFGLVTWILPMFLSIVAYLSVPALILYFVLFKPKIRTARTEGYDAGYAAAVAEMQVQQDTVQESYDDGYAQGIFITYIGSAMSALQVMDENGNMNVDDFQASLDTVLDQYMTEDITARINTYFDMLTEASNKPAEES